MPEKDIKEWIELLSGDAAGAEIELPVLSGSMDPFLPSGAVAVIRTLSRGDIPKLHCGAIIVYKDNFRLTAHRMVLKFPLINYVYEKGDRNRFGSFIASGTIIGVVSACKDQNNIIRNFFSRNQIKVARKEAFKNLFVACLNTLLIFPRRVKNVLEKK